MEYQTVSLLRLVVHIYMVFRDFASAAQTSFKVYPFASFPNNPGISQSKDLEKKGE